MKKPKVEDLLLQIKELDNENNFLKNVIRTQKEIIDKDSVLSSLRGGEPIFTLRAQDRIASMIIRLWADMTSTQSNRISKVNNAYLIAANFDDWAKNNKSQFPD